MKVHSVWAISPEVFPSIQNRILGQDFHAYTLAADEAVPKKEKPEAPPEYRLAPVKFRQSVHAIYLISPAK